MGRTPRTAGGGRSRRQMLRQSAGALAAVATGASAGCLNFLPPASRTIQYGHVDVPQRGPTRPVYRKWFPAESELPDLEAPESHDDLGWMYVTPGDLGRERIGQSFNIGLHLVQVSMDYVGYPMDAYDRVVDLDGVGSVAEGAIDRGRVRETLARTGYERVDGYRDYDVYDRTDIPRLVAVSDDAVVHTRDEKRREKAEILVDTGAGRATRRHETDDAFAAYTDRIGSAPTIIDGFHLVDGALLDSMRFTFDDSAGYYVYDHRFADGETPSVSDVKRQIAGLTRGQNAVRVDVTVESPYVSIALKLAKHAFRDDATQRRLPFVTLGVDDGANTITVRHEAGDDVSLDHVEVEPPDALAERPTDGVLDPGDELVFSRAALSAAGGEIRLTYQQSEDSTTTLFTYAPDQNDSTT